MSEPSFNEESAGIFTAAFRLAPSLCVITNAEGEVLAANETWLTRHGINPTSLVGKPWAAIISFLHLKMPLPLEFKNLDQRSPWVVF